MQAPLAPSLRAQRSGIPGTRWIPVGLTRTGLAWIWWPLAAYLLANLWLIGAGGDQRIADALYALQGGRWSLRDSWVTTALIHVTGKHLSTAGWLLVTVLGIVAVRTPRWQRFSRPLLALSLSIALTVVLVSLLKHSTAMDCPWDSLRYGGRHPIWNLFGPRPQGIRPSNCFPAGHASGGYCWIALYFFFLQMRPRWRLYGLGIGLAFGLVFGISQQLRGAHYLSHDLTTLAIAWFSALAMYLWWNRNTRAIAGLAEPIRTHSAA